MRYNEDKRSWKKIISFALAFLMMVGVIPIFSSTLKADAANKTFDKEIEVKKDQTARISASDSGKTIRVYTNGAVTMNSGLHGIFVENGFKGTIVLDNADIKTEAGTNLRSTTSAMFVDGSGYNDYSQITTSVLIELKGDNKLFSGTSSTTDAAGLEVWRGAKIIIDTYDQTDIGTLYAKSSSSTGSGGGGAGIGTGNRPFSGGHMVFRGGKIKAESGGHGAGIGDAWGSRMQPTNASGIDGISYAGLLSNTNIGSTAATNKKHLWSGTIVIYGDAVVESYGGYHGAGIGGACYATNQGSSPSGVVTSAILAVPRHDTITAKAGSGSTAEDLGSVGSGQKIYLGDPKLLPNKEISVRTENNHENAEIYMDLRGVSFAEQAISKLADQIQGQPLRNLYIDMIYFGNTGVKDGAGLAQIKRKADFDVPLTFYTTAPTPETNLNYDRKVLEANAPSRDVVLPYPSFQMEATGVPSTTPLSKGYTQQMSDNAASTVTVVNKGTSILKDVQVTVLDGGKDYFALIDSGGNLVRTITIPEIPAANPLTPGNNEVTIKVPLKAGLAGKDTAYEGVVSFYVSTISTTDTPDPVPVRQEVGTRTLTTVISPKDLGGNVVNKNNFKIQAVFEREVSIFDATGISVTNGTVVGGSITPIGTPVAGRYKEWEFTIKPDAGLVSLDQINVVVNQDATKDDHNQGNSKSNTLYFVYSAADPTVEFGFTENKYFNKNQANVSLEILANGTGTDYKKITVNGSPLSSSNVAGGIEVYQGNTKITTGLSYSISNNEVTINKSGGFGEGDYKVVVLPDYFENNIGNKLVRNERDFFVRIPTLVAESKPEWPGGSQGSSEIHVDPIFKDYKGGKVTVTIYGKNFQYADDGQLQIGLPIGVTDEAGNVVAAANHLVNAHVSADGKTATYDVILPRNTTQSDKAYNFDGYLNSSMFGNTSAGVLSANSVWTGNDYGLTASPRNTDYKEKEVDIRVKGENLHHYSGLSVLAYRNNVLTDSIPCAVTESGEVTIEKKYTIHMNSDSNPAEWEFKLSQDGTDAGIQASAGIGQVTQGAAIPGIHEFTVSEQANTKGNKKLVLDSNGGTVFFRIDGLNLHNFRPLTISNNGGLTPNPISDASLVYEGSDYYLAYLDPSQGVAIPQNRTQQDITYVFEVNKGATGTPTGNKVEVVVEKPSIGVDSVTVSPDKHDAPGGDSVFTLKGKHMQVAPLELRDQERPGFKFDVTDITNDGSDAKITINMPSHTGGLRNDIYNMEVYFNGQPTGLIATVEVGPSTPSITGGKANPNYFESASDTLEGKGKSDITVIGNYLFNYNTVQIYDRLYDKFYNVDIAGKDMNADVMVNVPSAKGIYTYDIFANGVKTEHSVNIHVGIPLGHSGDLEGADDAVNPSGGSGIKYEEFVGSGGGSTGRGYGGAHDEGFDLLKYQSERASNRDPKNPTVVIKNKEFISREQLDLAASGAKTGMLSSSKSGVMYVERNKLGILTLLLDTTTADDAHTLEGRIYLSLDRPRDGIYTGVHTDKQFTKATTKQFKDKFANKNIWVVHLVQNGSFGSKVEIAAKVDGFTNKTNKQKLYFYRLDRLTGEFKLIEDPDHYFDTSGYLHFTTEYGGDIIISDKLLISEGKSVNSGKMPVKNTNKPAVEDKE